MGAVAGSTVPPSLTDPRAHVPRSAAAPLGGRYEWGYLASAFSARALSVRSQLNSCSVRPKWP
jgi:hypothetical protein